MEVNGKFICFEQSMKTNETITQIDILLKHIFKYDSYTQNLNCSYPLIFKRTKRIMPRINSLFRILNLSEGILVASLLYVDRWTEKMNCYITRQNIYNLLITAIIISIKMHEDCDNKFDLYADIFDTDVDLLKKLEKKFLKNINYNLYIQEEQFQNYQQRLNKLK